MRRKIRLSAVLFSFLCLMTAALASAQKREAPVGGNLLPGWFLHYSHGGSRLVLSGAAHRTAPGRLG